MDKQEMGLTWASMFEHKVFVIKLAPIDGLATSAIVVGEISSLAHELWYHSMKTATFKTKALFMGAQTSKVFCQDKTK